MLYVSFERLVQVVQEIVPHVKYYAPIKCYAEKFSLIASLRKRASVLRVLLVDIIATLIFLAMSVVCLSRFVRKYVGPLVKCAKCKRVMKFHDTLQCTECSLPVHQKCQEDAPLPCMPTATIVS